MSTLETQDQTDGAQGHAEKPQKTEVSEGSLRDHDGRRYEHDGRLPDSGESDNPEPAPESTSCLPRPQLPEIVEEISNLTLDALDLMPESSDPIPDISNSAPETPDLEEDSPDLEEDTPDLEDDTPDSDNGTPDSEVDYSDSEDDYSDSEDDYSDSDDTSDSEYSSDGYESDGF